MECVQKDVWLFGWFNLSRPIDTRNACFQAPQAVWSYSQNQMDHRRALRVVIKGPPAGWRRPRGRPRQTWVWTVETDLLSANVGLQVHTAWHRAQDHTDWSEPVDWRPSYTLHPGGHATDDYDDFTNQFSFTTHHVYNSTAKELRAKFTQWVWTTDRHTLQAAIPTSHRSMHVIPIFARESLSVKLSEQLQPSNVLCPARCYF